MPREGVPPPVGMGGCLGLRSAALPPPAADLSFVLGQKFPESGGFGGPGPSLVICNRTQEGSGVGGMTQTTPHRWPSQLPHPTRGHTLTVAVRWFEVNSWAILKPTERERV